ncbi:MAG: hypothetical protein A2287_10245 [Candidatus Melainabacteria bacterium RIFOXYA12_FULL_32_12]|nr:MAG: hypothetical protein A2255_01145 [Candidatus Melainabacteria bacterium RIFOXYA2_FULL_32_9]OGI26497.1 MAG: hypothetical protein A2287_10245 [Candidatus Melainabacteria bacterium RIFOXYA12_FULL_32_12]
MLKEFSKYLRNKNIRPLITQENQWNSQFAQIPDIPERKKAELIEDSTLKIKHINIETPNSEFSYFLDGIERKVTFNDKNRFIPLIYGYVAAVIMKRTDKKMHSIGLEDKSEKIYLPVKTDTNAPENYVNPEELRNYNFTISNVGIKDEETGTYPQFPKEFERKAHSDIQETRGRLERGLVLEWLNQGHHDGWLFIDGRLENKNKEITSSSRIAGIIKSHHVYYFSPEDQNKIFNLKKGERSSVFQPEKENIYSWYLRLHESKSSGNIDFGIIRVEIPAKEELLSQVDTISSWILLETNPIAFPASRWDRMIYPVKYCEDYLKSKAPSWAVIESLC